MSFDMPRQLWSRQANPAVASFVLSSYAKIKRDLVPIPFRVAVLRSFTVEPVVVLCQAAAALAGIDIQFHVGDFNAYAGGPRFCKQLVQMVLSLETGFGVAFIPGEIPDLTTVQAICQKLAQKQSEIVR
jgi:hypothetical protein